MELVTLCSFATFKRIYSLVELKYAQQFPKHAAQQEQSVGERQILESPPTKDQQALI
jgi:hypothetical protein